MNSLERPSRSHSQLGFLGSMALEGRVEVPESGEGDIDSVPPFPENQTPSKPCKLNGPLSEHHGRRPALASQYSASQLQLELYNPRHGCQVPRMGRKGQSGAFLFPMPSMGGVAPFLPMRQALGR